MLGKAPRKCFVRRRLVVLRVLERIMMELVRPPEGAMLVSKNSKKSMLHGVPEAFRGFGSLKSTVNVSFEGGKQLSSEATR